MKSETEEIIFAKDNDTRPLLAKKSAAQEIQYYLYVITATVFFGTKLLFLGQAHFTKIWIFFIEHVAICISAILLFLGYYIFYKSRNCTFINYVWRENTLVQNRKIFYCALLSGTLNAFGNICIIMAIKFARDAGSSSSAINWILMMNVLIALTAGLLVFGERHRFIQYIGGIMVIGAVILITFERRLEKVVSTHKENNLHYAAVFFTVITWVSWSFMIITTKFSWYYYKANIVEYSALAMTLSGFVGSLTGIAIWHYGTPFDYRGSIGIEYHLMFAIGAGLFTTFGQFLYFSSVNLGSVEVAQLFVNMKPIVQLVEEAIFLFIFPSFWAFVGIFIAIVGSTLVILGKRESDNQHSDDKKQLSDS